MICYVYLTFTQYPYSCSSYEKWVVQCICNQRGREKVGKEEEAAVGSGSSELLEKPCTFSVSVFVYSIAQLQVHSPSLHNSYLVAIFTRKERVLKGI